MRIYSMTATFGKLDHETLTLQPGLNILEAPNEWGKSTWCGFLSAMLYGMDTRAKTTKTTLADKERFLPWSGSPMSGRIDLHWKGKDITIERKTKGRIPLGDFRAYETQSGIAVPGLTAANCGEQLLGIERSVFLRSAFIRHSDLPVTQDDALRSRLNALVTTGDESGDGDKLARSLKDLKNRVRYNRSGLLPQAEAQRDQISAKLRELENLDAQSQRQRQRLTEVTDWASALENHRAALHYAAAQADAHKVAQAEEACDEAHRAMTAAEKACRTLPPRDQVEQALGYLHKLEQARQDLHLESQMLPQPPAPPTAPQPYRDTDPETVARDARRHEALSAQKNLLPIIGIPLLLAGIALLFWKLLPGILTALLGAALLTGGITVNARKKRQLSALENRYGSSDPAQWISAARAYADAVAQYEAARLQADDAQSELRRRREALEEKIRSVTQNLGTVECLRRWQSALDAWDHFSQTTREVQRAESHRSTLLSMAKTAEKPTQPDHLTYTDSETARLLSDANAELQLLRSSLSQNQGRMESQGQKSALEADLAAANARIQALEDTYAALTIAQNTLADASAELQRRFAPRIAARAQALFSALTGGRYDRLSLGEDLTLRSAAATEDTLHDALWRSSGTADQMYLALRLAVAEALAPEAPLVLDDALIRFDDARLKQALTILEEEARHKQILLFTCQSREKQLQSQLSF